MSPLDLYGEVVKYGLGGLLIRVIKALLFIIGKRRYRIVEHTCLWDWRGSHVTYILLYPYR